ncbi:DUF998 domain-containing protein [Streptomyces sp. NPDC097619]|uniref:DUF998 domain-containing protein n=1 Tax=Streptomyces sp. NPDC097619 TaxID=3157228 RepID=UPI003322F54D
MTRTDSRPQTATTTPTTATTKTGTTIAAAPTAPTATRALSRGAVGRARLLGGAVLAGPFFLAAGITQGILREGYDFTRNAFSQLSLGEGGWIQRTVFVLTAALVLAGAAGLRQALRDGPGGTWAPRLVGLFGISCLAAAVFDADPGAGFPAGAPEERVPSMSTEGMLHMLAGMVGYLALCAAFLVLARHFAAAGARGWARGCRIVPAGVLAGFVGSAGSVLAFASGAALGLLWLAAVAARIGRGTPVVTGDRQNHSS